MTSPLDTIDLIVIHRNKSGKSDAIYPYNGNIATHMAACVNIARQIIASEKGLRSFIQLGNHFEKETQLKAWWGPDTMEEVTKNYVERLLKKWPPMVVDDTFSTPDHYGITYRKKYDTEFDTLKSAISINGDRFNHLCAAGREAQGFPDKNSKAHQRYRRFMVLVACTMVHELTHIYLTFLSKGGTNTPESIKSAAVGTSRVGKGESGAYLEQLLFGGCMVTMRNPAEGDEQSGEPHLIDKCSKLRQISQKTVDKMCRYEFEFPIPTDPVANPDDKRSLGHGRSLVDVTNPLNQPDTIALINAHERYGATAFPLNWEEVKALLETSHGPTTIRTDPQSAVYQLPFKPGHVAEAAK